MGQAAGWKSCLMLSTAAIRPQVFLPFSRRGQKQLMGEQELSVPLLGAPRVQGQGVPCPKAVFPKGRGEQSHS